MKKLSKMAVALALAGSVAAAATPASARPWGHGGYGGYHGRYYHHHGVSTGAAIGLGIAGLAVGAALAAPRGHDYYYDDAPPPPPPPPRSGGYWSYDYHPCQGGWVWDGRGYVPSRSCY